MGLILSALISRIDEYARKSLMLLLEETLFPLRLGGIQYAEKAMVSNGYVQQNKLYWQNILYIFRCFQWFLQFSSIAYILKD